MESRKVVQSRTERPSELEIVLDVRADLGEGPIWDKEESKLVFVDSTRGTIFTFDPATAELSQIKVGVQIGAAIPRRSGGYAVSSVDGVLGVSRDGRSTLIVPIESDRPTSRMNDAKCDSQGRMLSGTFSSDFRRGAGALYCIEDGTAPRMLLDGVTVSNGIGWSPDEAFLYYVDTSSRGIDRFDYSIETGAINNRHRLVDIDRAHGFPDGLCVDAEGFIWIALYRGGAVRRYAPDGALVDEIILPVSGVTSCNFAGKTLTDLYITTARHGVEPERLATEPLAGALFRCRLDVAGLPSHRFAG